MNNEKWVNLSQPILEKYRDLSSKRYVDLLEIFDR